jgi:tRNA-Thr(GGU) m(6)t(6)A37 methyltransferase TsaA
VEPIGFIESCYKDKFGTPRQPGLAAKAWAKLRLRADLHPDQALQGLEGFSHLWLIWVFHQNKVARYHAKVHPPRLNGESRGVFATRSPHRPNPIGLSLVEIVKIENGEITIAGADLVDGTPILDIKPYLPEIEAKPEARVGWTGEVGAREIQVAFAPEAEKILQTWQDRHRDKNIRDIIVDTLKLDPRPVVYRGYEGEDETPYRNEHAFRLLEGDVHFRFEETNKVLVFNILIGNN